MLGEALLTEHTEYPNQLTTEEEWIPGKGLESFLADPLLVWNAGIGFNVVGPDGALRRGNFPNLLIPDIDAMVRTIHMGIQTGTRGQVECDRSLRRILLPPVSAACSTVRPTPIEPDARE